MLGLKKKIFGDLGYTADLKLMNNELETFRDLISQQWLSVIKEAHPELADEAKSKGIKNYHQIADRLNHKQLWPKKNRVLPKPSVERIQNLPFMGRLRDEFGEFSISDIYDTKQHFGHPEIYWRLVRPLAANDVGPLHCDHWFHDAFNQGQGMFQATETTIKVWIPIYCEPQKSGLAIVPGSHLKEWKYHMVTTDHVPRPVLDEDPSTIDAKLISTEPGNMLIFNENVLHGGVVNQGIFTRVSAEITMVIK